MGQYKFCRQQILVFGFVCEGETKNRETAFNHLASSSRKDNENNEETNYFTRTKRFRCLLSPWPDECREEFPPKIGADRSRSFPSARPRWFWKPSIRARPMERRCRSVIRRAKTIKGGSFLPKETMFTRSNRRITRRWPWRLPEVKQRMARSSFWKQTAESRGSCGRSKGTPTTHSA